MSADAAPAQPGVRHSAAVRDSYTLQSHIDAVKPQFALIGGPHDHERGRTTLIFRRVAPDLPTIEIDRARVVGDALVANPELLPLQGGVAIVVDGQVVGGIGVAGANSAQQDEELAIAGANAFTADAMSSTSPVSYFESKMVAAAFSNGAVLLDGADGRNYMVHASHRDKPGLAEIHTLDTDIVYVLEGTATFVTGGKAVEAKTIAPNEIRGSAIEGGDTRKLVKGDVIIVPAGTPHWFKEVPGPLNYYVVKAR